MNFTRQDIETIARRLRTFSQKDSEFATVKEITEDDRISLIKQKSAGVFENKTISLNKLTDSVAENIDLSKIPFSVEETTFENLKDALLYLVGKVITITPHDVTSISADEVLFEMSEGSEASTTVGPALRAILDILYGRVPFPTAADQSDITYLFTQINNQQVITQ